MEEKNFLQTFKRSRKDRWLGGICGALGARTPAPSWAWRLLFVLPVHDLRDRFSSLCPALDLRAAGRRRKL